MRLSAITEVIWVRFEVERNSALCEQTLSLSAATASPTHFLVVQAWAVSDGAKAEKAAHDDLDRFRPSSSREFFQSRYADLCKSIEASIAPWELG